jgi:8-oxo-dGTP pyrophosphatase MutT (NUDIX family)
MMAETGKFLDFLKDRLNGSLPGRDSHMKMMPEHSQNKRSYVPPPDASQSAVLVLLLGKGDKLSLIFTLRSMELNSHKGQISFPGGRSEQGEDAFATALREAHEEIGLEPARLSILGKLSVLFVPPSRSVITPVVAYSDRELALKINGDEVAEVFAVDLDKFLDISLFKTGNWSLMGETVMVPYWDVHPTTPLWGATAMILRELLDIYDEFLSINLK